MSRQSSMDPSRRRASHCPSARPSAAVRSSAASSTRMPSSLGNTSTGSSPATPRSSRRRAGPGPVRGLLGGQPAGPQTASSARTRKRASRPASAPYDLPPAPGRPTRVEPEYGAAGPCNTWPPGTSTRAVMGRCEAKTGIAPFGRLVEQVMERAVPLGGSRVLGGGQRLVASGRSRGQADAPGVSAKPSWCICRCMPVG